jgi:chemotaxis protein methyltransferase CheR
MVFAHHNLATDTSFNKFNVILCRNVMIYFNLHLQERVHKLFYENLGMFGILGLGDQESLSFTPYGKHYEAIEISDKLYRKI